MKKLSILLSVFAAISMQAQDTLYTISGQKIPAKVIEINQTEIKYKKATNLDGPTYVVDKNDVALIEYKNGTKELFGTGAENNDEQAVANNEPKQHVNVIIGTLGWPPINTWGWWGGYRVYPRLHFHRHHYYKPYRYHRHYHHGRRGR